MRRLTPLAALCIMLPVFAAPPADEEGESMRGHRGPPPHVLLLEHADELGIDAATAELIEQIAEEGRELGRDASHEDRRAVMDEIMGLLTEEQVEAAREILPPPPGERCEKE